MKTLLMLIMPCVVYGALSANTVWYAQSGGSDTNGGGVVAGSTVNMANYANKNLGSCTGCYSATVDLSTTDVVTTNTTTVTSASCNCDANLVGQTIYLSGTGTTTGWYQVASLTFASPPAAIITVDRATGSTGGTGVTMNIGGALASMPGLASAMVSSNTALVKAGTGTFSVTSSSTSLTPTSGLLMVGAVLTFTTTGTLPAPLALNTKYYVLTWSGTVATIGLACVSPPFVACGSSAIPITFTNTGSGTHTLSGLSYTQTATATFSGSSTPGQANRLIGYTSTPGDGGRAYISLTTNTGLTGLKSTGNGWDIENMAVDCGSLGTSTGINFSGSYSWGANMMARNCASGGISISSGSVAMSEVAGSTGGSAITASAAMDNFVHDGTGGANGITGSVVTGNLIVNMLGASNNAGILSSALGPNIQYNTIYNIGGYCISISTAFDIAYYFRHNIMERCGQYGIGVTTAAPSQPMTDGNAYLSWYSTGNTINLTLSTGVYAYSIYANQYDRNLMAEAFNAPASGDFSLNTLSSGGASARGYAYLGDLPGYVGQGLNDFGAISHFGIAVASSGGPIKGPVFSAVAVPPAPNWVAEGDSITSGFGQTLPYPTQVRNGLSTYINFANVSTAGQTCAQNDARYSTNVAPHYSSYFTTNIASIMCGANDAGGSAATSYSHITSWVSAAKATGFTVWVGLMTDRTGFDTFTQALNTLIVNGAAGNGYSVFGSLAASPMYCNGCSTNATYFQGDGTHITNAGATVVAGYVTGLFNALGIF